MRPRNLLFITLAALCHLQLGGQALTNALPAPQQPAAGFRMTVADGAPDALSAPQAAALPYGLPDDPGQELMPVAVPEQAAKAGVPVKIEALKQTRVGDVWTLEGKVVIDYKGYVIRADKIVYNQATSEVEADGHLQVTGGPYDVLIEATHGQMRLNAHTARFYNVTGSEGVRSLGRAAVYSTVNPLLFSARVLLENGEGNYKIVDGSITNCRLPHPDWRILARQIELDNRVASTSNARFDFLGVPIFYLPYLRHPASENGRESGLLIPVISTGSSIRGFTFGEQVYWAINRSMDMVVGSEYFSKRGWAPNGDFRYKGLGLDHLIVHWNALLDRGVEQPVGVAAPAPADRGVHELPDAPGLSLFDESAGEPSGSTAQPASRTGSSGLPVFAGMVRVNQGGVDVGAEGRKDFTPATRLAGAAEYLSSYTYRLVFNDNYTQATSSQVTSVVGLTHNHNGRVLSGSLERFQSFASTANGDEVKVLHLPSARYDVLARPLWNSPFYWWFSSSAGFLNRSEPDFHARNVGRFDIYPHLSLPLSAGGWSLVPEFALRDTHYTISQTPDLTGANGGIPYISHDPLVRTDLEASIDIRPPALERDFTLPFGHRVLRHVIEPEITYNYVGGIGAKARNVLLFDTTDIAANTNQVGYSLTQHFYLKPAGDRSCGAKDGGGDADGGASGPSRQLNQMDRLNQAGKSDQADQANQADHAVNCAAREWATWQIAQDFYFDPNFGGALIPGRRNVFNAALDLTPVAFLTSPRNISPIVSRLRFNAISNLRFEWDLDYDPKAGQLDADNLFAGYSWGRTTLGVEHALLNAVDENTGTSSTTLKSQQLHPFLAIGKPNGEGFNLAINGGYDFVIHQVQYAGMQAAYNWNCCGLTLGYRRFELGSEGTVSRDETQWLYSFTLANFGGVGDIRRANSVFRDPSLPSAY